MAQNFGDSDRLRYDNCAYKDALAESEAPASYILDSCRNFNKDGFLSSYGTYGNVGVSTSTQHSTTQPLDLTDDESLLKGLHVRHSNCKSGHYNKGPGNKTLHHQKNSNKLESVATRLNNPAITSKSIATNRFYCIHNNPQKNIFWNFSENTRLSARDNYVMQVPNVNNIDSVSPSNGKCN